MVEKVRVVIIACLFMILCVSNVMAFGLPSLPKSSGVKVDADALSSRSTAVMKNVRIGTIAFAESLVNIEIALGHKEQAEKLQQAINNVNEKKDDPAVMKVLVEENNKAADELAKVDLKSNIDKEKAKSNLATSILKIGVGVIFDGIAVKDAAVLLKDSKDAVKSVSFTAVGKVKDVISTTTFVGTEIPPQISNLQKISGKLIDYAQTNGIPTPSKEDIAKKVKELEEN